MQKSTEYFPTDDDVRHIFSDVYRFFLQYKDIDIVDCCDEIYLAYQTIYDNYQNCDLVKNMLDSVMELLKEKSEKYQRLVGGLQKNN